MKKLFSFLTILLLIVSCSNDDDFGNAGSSALQPISFTVNAKYDSSFNNLASSGATVTITNSSTGDIYTATTDTNGAGKFASILPGTYKITISKKMTAEEFSTAFGYTSSTAEVIFNGSQENVTANTNVTSTTIELKSARVGDLVIKQVYYSGSSATQGAVFRDQFIEIFNNSNEVIYADGLYIGQLYGKTSTTSASYTLSNGQFDWSKSVGMTMGDKANTEYVYADYVFRIPGNGIQYPIQPGESILIAQTAVNHKSPLVGNDGDPITINDPTLTVNLSTANFESYLGDFRTSIGESVYQYDIQNPAVADLQIAYWGKVGSYSGNKDFIMDSLGRDSFVIFRADDFTSYKEYSDPSVTSVTSSTKFFVQIPNSMILDGVDLQHYNTNSQRPKMLQSSIDASSIACDASYNSQSVIRKTKTTINGRIVLEDTNNSANDFVKRNLITHNTPKGFDY
jgi:hypothetical protein